MGKIRHGVTLADRSVAAHRHVWGLDLGGAQDSSTSISIAPRLSTVCKGRNFYAVGGTWRNLARLHMAQTHYPLHVLHQYAISREQARSVADLVSGLSASSLQATSRPSRAAARTHCRSARWCSSGCCRAPRPRASSCPSSVSARACSMQSSPNARRNLIRLLAGCWDFCRRYARSPEHELELCDWTNRPFRSRWAGGDRGAEAIAHGCLPACRYRLARSS